MVNPEYYIEEFYTEEYSFNSIEPEVSFHGWDIYKDDGITTWLVGRFNTLEEAQQHFERNFN